MPTSAGGDFPDGGTGMTYWTAILLGLIQGLAEFLPISSSGHLAILQNFLRIGDLENQMLFAASGDAWGGDLRVSYGAARALPRGPDDAAPAEAQARRAAGPGKAAAAAVSHRGDAAAHPGGVPERLP